MRVPVLLLSVLGATSGYAQSTIYGLDVRYQRFFRTNTASFVASFQAIGPNTKFVFALDFDANADQMWGIRDDTYEYGVFNLSSGAFQELGTINAPHTDVRGITAAVDGSTWYLMEYRATSSESHLWVGDVTTGTFSEVGMTISGDMIDISIDSQGNLYGYSVTDDSLYSIDTTTGAGTFIGPIGIDAYASPQGIDFDWSDDTLYATIFIQVGGIQFDGDFVTLDLTTGAATLIEPTDSLDGAYEIAIREPVPDLGAGYCFGDGSGSACPCSNPGGAGEGCANSSGSGGTLTPSGSLSVAADNLDFTGSNLLPGQPALLFAGQNAINGGAGVPFGDGLRCAGDNVVRLGVAVPDGAGEASWGPALGASGGWSAGDVRRFQAWYRDPGGSPCGFDFNLTHGWEVTFQP